MPCADIGRLKLIKALWKQLLLSVFWLLFALLWIGVAAVLVFRVVDLAIDGRNILWLLDLDDNWLILILFAISWCMIVYTSFYAEGGYILDVLLLRIEKRSGVSRNDVIFPFSTDTSNYRYAEVFPVQIGRKEPLNLLVNRKLTTIPYGTEYDIFYLKRSRVIVHAEVLEGFKPPEKNQMILMDEPVIPKYSKVELKAMTKPHHWRPIGLFFYCLAGFGALVAWAIHTLRDPVYWYIREAPRAIRGLVFFTLLEVFLICIFRHWERGYFPDLHRGDIAVSEVIPVSDIYGRKFIWKLNTITGVQLEVTNGTHKRERFLLYTNISEYWNCFPMNILNLPRRRYGGIGHFKFEAGQHRLKAVRLYYLKRSRIVVKVEIIKED